MKTIEQIYKEALERILLARTGGDMQQIAEDALEAAKPANRGKA